MRNHGYELLELTARVCVFKSHDPDRFCVAFPGSDPQVSETLIRKLLWDEHINPDEIIGAVRGREQETATDQEELGFKIHVEAAIKVLETTPHPPANRSQEDLKAIAQILKRIDSRPKSNPGITDASEDLGKYIYDPYYNSP